MVFMRFWQGVGAFFTHLLVFTSRIKQPLYYLKQPAHSDWQAISTDISKALERYKNQNQRHKS